MTAIGWLDTGITEADTFFSTRMGAISLWAALSSAQKTAALTTAYNILRHSPQLSIPTAPTAAQKAVLAYGQEEFSLYLIVTDEGGLRRFAAQWQNITSAGLVKESYADNSKKGLPKEIIDILDEFKTEQPLYSVNIYRDETNNPAWDTVFESDV